MILRPIPPFALRLSRIRPCRHRAPSSSPSRFFSASQSQRLHNVPRLTHGDAFEKTGIPDLMTPKDFERVWTKQQKWLVEQINERTMGTVDEGSSVKTILLQSARQADKAALFNYASMAHNNHFFFESISSQPVPMSTHLTTLLEEDFSSIESLKKEFLATGNAMFGPGFVWLVKVNSESYALNRPAQFRILATYLAGSPYPGAHYRQQPVDMNTQGTPIQKPTSEADAKAFIARSNPANNVGVYGRYSEAGRLKERQPLDLATSLVPVLCVNVWEHAWLEQFGFGGKKWYLESWWNHINWKEVEARAELRAS